MGRCVCVWWCDEVELLGCGVVKQSSYRLHMYACSQLLVFSFIVPKLFLAAKLERVKRNDESCEERERIVEVNLTIYYRCWSFAHKPSL